MREANVRWWIAGVVVAAALVGGAFAVASSLGDDTSASGEVSPATATSAEPKPITRDELMEQYTQLRPNDATATPDAVDQLAEEVCDRLDRGESTDELITAFTDVYQVAATTVVHLFVSYGCPEHLAEFK